MKTGKTARRYPIPNQLWAFTDNVDLGLGVPAWAIRSMDLMVGWTHPDMGQLQTILDHYRNGLVERQLTLRSYQNAGEANNFTSYDLLNKGVIPSEFTSGGVWYLQSWDKTADSKKGQMEYMQLQITVHTLPNRADADADGLNDSEELNLGSDGFSTDPWKADTDGDGLADNEFAIKGTSPLLADTDRDGYRDNVDRVPLGDAFVEISINSVYVSGSDPHNPNSMPYPFVKVTIQGNSTYTTPYWDRSAVWYTFDEFVNRYDGHRLSVNVPDDVAQFDFTVEVWSKDDRGYNEHTRVIAGSHTEYLGGVPYCVDDPIATRVYTLQGAGQSTPYSLSGCSSSSLRANPLSLTVRTIVPNRIAASLILPADYAGVYNVTDASGGIVGRRYVGEPRLVTILLNVTTYDYEAGCYCGPAVPLTWLVPRSVFFETRLYAYLNDSNPIAPLNKLAFRQNATSASSNSDAIQQILTGNVTEGDAYAIANLLLENETGANVRLALPLTNDLFLYSLPDDAVRLVGYKPPPTARSWTYTFCSGSCGPPTPKPWWEQVWTGLLIVVAAVVSAMILPITGFANLVQLLVQVGNWLWTNIVGPGIAVVASAVQAAGEAFDQFVDGLVQAIMSIWNSIVVPLTKPIVDAYTSWANEVAALVMSIRSLSVGDFVRGMIQLTFFSAFALAVFAIIVAFSVAEKITNAMTLGLANVAGIVIGAITGLIIGMLVVSAINEWLGSDVIEDLLPPGFDEVTGATFTVAQFLFAYELAQRPLKPIRGIESGLHDATVGLMLLGVGTAIRLFAGDSLFGLIALVIVGVVALFKELSGLSDVIAISGRGANLVRMWYPFLYPVTVAMNAIGIATTATELAGDAGRLVNRLGEG